ncbi:hypothetical protein, partial [Robertkochia marina]
MFEIFSNREWAIFLWISIFLAYYITKQGVRKSMKRLINVFFSEGIIDIVFFIILYFEIIILGLTLIEFWEIYLLKDTLLFVAFIAFPLAMKLSSINDEDQYLYSILQNSFKGIIIIEFIANVYSFSLLVELILIPVMTIIAF